MDITTAVDGLLVERIPLRARGMAGAKVHRFVHHSHDVDRAGSPPPPGANFSINVM